MALASRRRAFHTDTQRLQHLNSDDMRPHATITVDDISLSHTQHAATRYHYCSQHLSPTHHILNKYVGYTSWQQKVGKVYCDRLLLTHPSNFIVLTLVLVGVKYFGKEFLLPEETAPICPLPIVTLLGGSVVPVARRWAFCRANGRTWQRWRHWWLRSLPDAEESPASWTQSPAAQHARTHTRSHWANTINMSALCFLHQLTAWSCPRLLLSAGAPSRRTVQQSIDLSCPQGDQQQSRI